MTQVVAVINFTLIELIRTLLALKYLHIVFIGIGWAMLIGCFEFFCKFCYSEII
jgi:hypothetical protein